MQYNMKIREFGNGQIEVKLYDKPIFELTAEEKERRNKKRLATIENRVYEERVLAEDMSEYYETLGGDYIAMDAVGEWQRLVTEDEFIANRDNIRKRKNAKDSRRRTINAIHDIARSEKWERFYTLTFSPECVDRTDFDTCMKKANKWLNNMKSRKAKDLKYLIVPELHADGVSWHIHGLVACDSGIPYVDSGKRDKGGKTIYNVDSWKYGFSTATDIVDSKRASSYILKYITKDMCANSFGKKRYYHSKNIAKPIESTYDCSIDFGTDSEGHLDMEFLDEVIDSLGLDSVDRVERVVTEHCSVTYINAHREEREEM